MDDNLYDEFGNYIGPELADSSEEESESEEEEEEEEEEDQQDEVRYGKTDLQLPLFTSNSRGN